MSQGDYNFYQRRYSSKNTKLNVLAATDDTTLITPKSANHQIYVQRIVIEITTYSAKTWTFEDSAGTPVPIKHISIGAAAVALVSESSNMVADFGPEGIALTLGKNLVLNMSAAGAAGVVSVEAYERLVGPVALAPTN
jgi:hypothetical protein